MKIASRLFCYSGNVMSRKEKKLLIKSITPEIHRHEIS